MSWLGLSVFRCIFKLLVVILFCSSSRWMWFLEGVVYSSVCGLVLCYFVLMNSCLFDDVNRCSGVFFGVVM